MEVVVLLICEGPVVVPQFVVQTKSAPKFCLQANAVAFLTPALNFQCLISWIRSPSSLPPSFALALKVNIVERPIHLPVSNLGIPNHNKFHSEVGPIKPRPEIQREVGIINQSIVRVGGTNADTRLTNCNAL